MADELNSLPVPSGDQIETIKLASGLHIPSSFMAGQLADGDLQYLRALADGSLQVEGGARGVASAEVPGDRLAVGTASAQLLAAAAGRRYLSVVNLEGPGDVWLSWGGTAEEGHGIPVLVGGSWEMPADVRWSGVVNAIATEAGTFVAVSAF